MLSFALWNLKFCTVAASPAEDLKLTFSVGPWFVNIITNHFLARFHKPKSSSSSFVAIRPEDPKNCRQNILMCNKLLHCSNLNVFVAFFPPWLNSPPPSGPGPLFFFIDTSRSHSDTPQSVGLLWTSDQLVAETSTWQHTIFTRERHPCHRRDSNPQSQQASGRIPTAWTARSLRSAVC